MSLVSSDLSDTTSFLEDDELNFARSKRTTSARFQPDRRHSNTRAYTIVDSLRAPRSTSHAVGALYEQIMDGSIKLDLDYQTDIVWSEEKHVGLIDSIFRNYYIPSIIFACSTTDDGGEIRVCIDGKERLRSIWMFMDGRIPHRDHITAECYWYKKPGSHAGLLLPKRLQRSFQYKQIQCVEYDGLTEEQGREIFQRVKLGLALTPARGLHELPGPWPDFLREIKSQIIGDHRFGDSFEWGRTPWRDFNTLASIVYLIEQLPAWKSPPTHQTLETWLKKTTPIPQPELRTGVRDTLRVYLSLAEDEMYKKPFGRPVSSIEFIMIGVMVFTKRETLSLTQLSHAVEIMRVNMRPEKKYVSNNERVSKLPFELMDTMPLRILRSDKRGDKSAQSTLPPLSCEPTSARPLESRPNKRKLGVGVEDNYSDSSSNLAGGSNDERTQLAQRAIGPPRAKVPRLGETVRPPPSIHESALSRLLLPQGPQPSPSEDQSYDIEPSMLLVPPTPYGDDDYDRIRGYDRYGLSSSRSQSRSRSAPLLDHRCDHSFHSHSPGSDSESGGDAGGRSGVGYKGLVAGGPGGGVSNVNVNISLPEARKRS